MAEQNKPGYRKVRLSGFFLLGTTDAHQTAGMMTRF